LGLLKQGGEAVEEGRGRMRGHGARKLSFLLQRKTKVKPKAWFSTHIEKSIHLGIRLAGGGSQLPRDKEKKSPKGGRTGDDWGENER